MTDKVINGVVTQKLEVLDTNLKELSSLGTITVPQLESDWRTLKAVQRNLQILVEIVIDVCNRLLAVDGQTPSTTSREAVKRCILMGILADYEPYEKMVRFRNFIVHNYDQIDNSILVNMVNRNLGDFRRFRDEVLAYANQQSSD